jgi:hypothetical protein
VTFPAANIRDWRGKAVQDPEGNKIGTLEAVYFDTALDQAVFATVQIGVIGRRRLAFVPLIGATVAPEHVTVQVSRNLARKAPTIDMDGELAAADEPAIFMHYGLDYQQGASGERRLARR